MFFFLPLVSLAHQPELPVYESYNDTKIINDTQLSQAFYATLAGFPHTYTFTLDERKPVFVQVLVPDIPDVKNNRSALIVKQEPQGGVTEVARLRSTDANWESYYEWFSGDRYRNGPEYTADLGAGTYLLEVSTADNQGKYVLVVGTEERSTISYFETMKRIYLVKHFFNKSGISILQSPLFTVPLLILLCFVYILYRAFKKYRHA